MQGVNVFIMTAKCGFYEARRRFQAGHPPRFHRPSHDSTPGEAEYLTEREVETLRRRVAAYLSECRKRRQKELKA